MLRKVIVLVGMLFVLSACGVGEDWKNTNTPLQQLEKAIIAKPQPAAAPAQPETYSAMTNQVRAFNGSVCLESQAEFTGKQWICPKSRELCTNAGKAIVVDDYGFVSCK